MKGSELKIYIYICIRCVTVSVLYFLMEEKQRNLKQQSKPLMPELISLPRACCCSFQSSCYLRACIPTRILLITSCVYTEKLGIKVRVPKKFGLLVFLQDGAAQKPSICALQPKPVEKFLFCSSGKPSSLPGESGGKQIGFQLLLARQMKFSQNCWKQKKVFQFQVFSYCFL